MDMEFGMFQVSKNIVAKFGNKFVECDSHDHSNGDWEDTDCLWIERTPDDETCEGQYIDIGMVSKDGNVFHASLNSADRFGGHPTYWSVTGSEKEVEQALNKYLED